MQDFDGRILRAAGLPAAAVGAVLIAICSAVAGLKGFYGSALGVLIAGAFFGVTLVVLGRVAKKHPMVFMNAAMATYLGKIIVLGVLLVLLMDATAFDTKAFGWSILVSALVWSAAEIRAFSKLKVFYVEPNHEPGPQP